MYSRSAARPKCSSSATATKYRSLRRSTSAVIPSGYYSGPERSWTAAARRAHRGREPINERHPSHDPARPARRPPRRYVGHRAGHRPPRRRPRRHRDRCLQQPESVRRALGELPDTASGTAVDLTDPEAVAAFFAGLEPFDHLVYTAGEALSLLEVRTLDLARARQAFELRYFGALSAIRSAVPKLRPGGSVVLTSGTAADRPGPGWSVAASICGAADSLVRALAVELAPIRVNAVKPGVVRTPLWPEGFDYDAAAESLPVGRIGEPEDIAEAYLFLMNQQYATGSIVTVGGGNVLV
ncbi:SDR family oxidoreductase [Kribbella sp. NPDC020789]